MNPLYQQNFKALPKVFFLLLSVKQTKKEYKIYGKILKIIKKNLRSLLS